MWRAFDVSPRRSGTFNVTRILPQRPFPTIRGPMTSGMLADAETPIRPLVELSDAHMRLDPGQVGQTEITVRNPGNIVETYDLTILGTARAVGEITPPTLSLFPGDEDTATLELRPLMSHVVLAGTYAVGVKVQSQVRADVSTTAEMLVTINPFYRFRCMMATNSFTIRTRATMLVQVTNEGNSTVTYEVTAMDPEGYMRVQPKDPRITLAPGESRWVEVQVHVAPKLVGSAYDTRSFTVTVTPVRDEDLDLPLIALDSEVVIGSVLQKPFVRLRLGVFGRLLVLLTILGLIAAFFISRWLSGFAPPVQGPPTVPASFAAEPGPAPGQVLLTWLPSVGADGYTIYSVGEAGNPQPSPQPTIVVEIPGQTGGAVGGISRSVIPRADREPSDEELSSPVCLGCTEVEAVDQGVTRFVVQDVPPGIACYRIAARAEGLSSLYSVPTCTEVADPTFVDTDGDGIPDAFQDELSGADGEDLPPRPCPPVNLQARPLSTTAVALLWGRATTPPPGFREPRAGRLSALSNTETTQPFGDNTVRGGGDAVGAPGAGSRPSFVCDPGEEITGWVVQRRIFSGWADVSPSPGVDDTAMEVTGLDPDTRYCFRMRAQSAERVSRWTPRTCVRTDAEPIEDAPASPLPPATNPGAVAADPQGSGAQSPDISGSSPTNQLSNQVLGDLPR